MKHLLIVILALFAFQALPAPARAAVDQPDKMKAVQGDPKAGPPAGEAGDDEAGPGGGMSPMMSEAECRMHERMRMRMDCGGGGHDCKDCPDRMRCGDRKDCDMDRDGRDGCCGKCGTSGRHGMGGGVDDMTWPPMQRACRTPEFYMGLREELSLSDYQEEAMKKLVFQMKKETTLKGAAVKVLEMELTEMVTRPDFKLQDALDKLKEIEKARTELRAAVIKLSSEARDLLGPEQIDILKGLELGPDGRDAAPGMRPSMMKRMMMEKMKGR